MLITTPRATRSPRFRSFIELLLDGGATVVKSRLPLEYTADPRVSSVAPQATILRCVCGGHPGTLEFLQGSASCDELVTFQSFCTAAAGRCWRCAGRTWIPSQTRGSSSTWETRRNSSRCA